MIKYMLGLPLMFGAIGGLMVSLLGNIVVTSSLHAVNDLELSACISIFSVVAFICGLYTLLNH